MKSKNRSKAIMAAAATQVLWGSELSGIEYRSGDRLAVCFDELSL